MSAGRDWFVRLGPTRLGPISLAALRGMVDTGVITPLHQVSSDGARWRPVSECPELLGGAAAEGGASARPPDAAVTALFSEPPVQGWDPATSLTGSQAGPHAPGASVTGPHRPVPALRLAALAGISALVAALLPTAPAGGPGGSASPEWWWRADPVTAFAGVAALLAAISLATASLLGQARGQQVLSLVGGALAAASGILAVLVTAPAARATALLPPALLASVVVLARPAGAAPPWGLALALPAAIGAALLAAGAAWPLPGAAHVAAGAAALVAAWAVWPRRTPEPRVLRRRAAVSLLAGAAAFATAMGAALAPGGRDARVEALATARLGALGVSALAVAGAAVRRGRDAAESAERVRHHDRILQESA